MCVSNYWIVTEDYVRKATMSALTYYFLRLIMMVDYRDNTLNEGNEDDEPANMIAYRLVIQDLIQLLQDQQEFR